MNQGSALAMVVMYVMLAMLATLSQTRGDEAESAPAVRAVDFRSQQVYKSQQDPSYTSWVSFFPGERGQWYLTCEEVTRPDPPLPKCTRQQWYEMSLPDGYDKSQYRMEIVMLESQDNMKTWRVISRQPVRFQHSAGSFGQARTTDGRFLRFLWSCYSLDPTVHPNEILYESTDNGQTWVKKPPFHNDNFVSYPHRLRTLHDGTLVLCVPLAPKWGQGTDLPVRGATRLDVINQMQMSLFFSFDQGRTWRGPLPIFGGQTVSETDFVELPSGDLLFVNNSIFANPGRQFVYREGQRFTPGPLEKVRAGTVPETVCLTDQGILVGCMRAGTYYWSDDLGQTWQKLEGTAGNGEVYQPWIQYLPDGRIACAGHLGADDPIGSRDQHISIHFFRLEVLRKTKDTKLFVERDFDEEHNRWRNAYTIVLTCNGQPLPNKELEFSYLERNQPETARKNIKLRTDADGTAHVALPHLDEATNIHLSYQFVVRFNIDRADPEYKPAQTPQMLFYARSHWDPPQE